MVKIKWNKDVLLCTTLMIYLVIMDLLIKYIAGLDLFQRYSVMFNVCFISFIGAVCALFKTKGKYIFSTIIGLIVAIYGFSQAMHYQVFNTFYSIAKISMLAQLNDVKTGAASVIDIFSLQVLIPFIILMLVNSLIYFRLKESMGAKKPRHRFVLSFMVSLLAISGCGFSVAAIPDYPQHVRSYEYLYERLYNKSLAVNYFGVYSYMLKDIYNSFIKRNKAEIASIKAYQQDNAYPANINEYTGLFEGKNLILVLAESLSKYSLNEQFTPFMYQMAQEGILFDKHYAPLFDANTADSELIALTGTMPSTEGSITPNHYFMNHYNSALPNLLKNNGYHTLSFHSWFKEFYNRNVTHYSYGFEHYYADDELVFNKFDNWTRALNWPKDTELFAQVLPLTNTEQPFMDFIISATTHMPYRKDRKELREAMEWLKDSGYTNSNNEVFIYNASLHELDSAMENLVNELEEKGLLDDTVICVFGDHYPYGMSDQCQQDYFGDLYNTVDMYQTPFFIYAKGIEPKVIHQMTSTFDIYPTLANLFGLDINGNIIFGSDALDNNFEPMIYFSDYSWMNEHAYYNASNQITTYFDDTLSQDDIDRINGEVIEALTIGQDLLASDSFSYKDGKLLTE